MKYPLSYVAAEHKKKLLLSALLASHALKLYAQTNSPQIDVVNLPDSQNLL